MFGINPSSTRKKIPGNYAINIESLESILLLANKLKINVLLYVVPLRNDFKIPYDEDEYELFKEELKSLSDMYNTYYINLENLIRFKFLIFANYKNPNFRKFHIFPIFLNLFFPFFGNYKI